MEDIEAVLALGIVPGRSCDGGLPTVPLVVLSPSVKDLARFETLERIRRSGGSVLSRSDSPRTDFEGCSRGGIDESEGLSKSAELDAGKAENDAAWCSEELPERVREISDTSDGLFDGVTRGRSSGVAGIETGVRGLKPGAFGPFVGDVTVLRTRDGSLVGEPARGVDAALSSKGFSTTQCV